MSSDKWQGALRFCISQQLVRGRQEYRAGVSFPMGKYAVKYFGPVFLSSMECSEYLYRIRGLKFVPFKGA